MTKTSGGVLPLVAPSHYRVGIPTPYGGLLT
jgi:hypothetical protein